MADGAFVVRVALTCALLIAALVVLLNVTAGFGEVAASDLLIVGASGGLSVLSVSLHRRLASAWLFVMGVLTGGNVVILHAWPIRRADRGVFLLTEQTFVGLGICALLLGLESRLRERRRS